MLHALLVMAADPGRGGQDPRGVWGPIEIALVVFGVVVVASVLFGVFHRLSRASRGGVQPRQEEFRRGAPPFEGIGRRR